MSTLYCTYISQDLARKTVGDKELLFGDLMNNPFDRLGFTIQLYKDASFQVAGNKAVKIKMEY